MSESIKGLKRTHRCAELRTENIGETVTVMGWVKKRRNLGNLIFIDLRDRSGIIQLVFDQTKSGERDFMRAGTLRAEFVIAAVGKVIKRGGAVNPDLVTGDIEVEVTELRILSEAETPPFHIEDDLNAREELRLKYRYLDLRRPCLQKNLMLRSRVTTEIRKFMAEEGFLEIETPMLTKSTPEGARDYLVPSRVHPGTFYALPQSPQLFKQLLMCAGYDRYIQIVKCFRDEDLRADRQPEFTQIDMELSFVDEEDVMAVNERLMQHVFKSVLNIDIPLPMPRMTWQSAMDRFGSDKPDIRYGMELRDVSDLVADCGFSVFSDTVKAGNTVRVLRGEKCGDLPRKRLDALTEYAKGCGAKGLAYLVINEDGTYKSSFAKFMTEEELKAIVERAEGEPGDLLLFAADKKTIVWNVLGAIRQELAKEKGLVDKNEFRFLWITDFPLLDYDEEEQRYVAEHHPFTMMKDEDIPLLDTDPSRVRAKAYDITLNGYELGGGSVRIHQGEIQEKMFELLGFTKEEAHERFGFLLDAFKYGVPPHAGLAYGLDRLVMLMAGEDNIREVIAFPKVKDASCLMTDAPNFVDEKQLRELYLETIPSEEEKE